MYYSDKGTVYHIYNDCTLGNNIETVNRKSGTGGKPLCQACAERKKLENRKKK